MDDKNTFKIGDLVRIREGVYLPRTLERIRYRTGTITEIKYYGAVSVCDTEFVLGPGYIEKCWIHYKSLEKVPTSNTYRII